MSKIISLNIIKKSNTELPVYLNPTNFPILFFWNGQNTMIQEMKADEEFMKLLLNQICTVNNYSSSFINVLSYDMDTEEYKQYTIAIQDFIDLDDDLLGDLEYSYIETILLNLYKIAMKKDYKLIVESSIDNILNIYTILKNTYKERVSPTTIKQYILSELQQTYKLNNNNCNYVIQVFNDIIS